MHPPLPTGQPPSVRPPVEPLDTLYRRAGRPLPSAAWIDPAQLPEPQRALLDHASDMTSTLEGFHRDTIHLEVLSRSREGDSLWREVVLTLDTSGRPVEFGAIRIHLPTFPEPWRGQILEGRRPLGGILNASGMAYLSRPTGFFRLQPDAFMCRALRLGTPEPLYGRCNVLRTAAGDTIAEIVEVLPPGDGARVAPTAFRGKTGQGQFS